MTREARLVLVNFDIYAKRTIFGFLKAKTSENKRPKTGSIF